MPPSWRWRNNVKDLEIPRHIPWDMLKPHEEQAKINHNQSLERLRQRGGLCFTEAVAILHARRWWDMYPDFTLSKGLSDEDVRWAAEELIRLVNNYNQQNNEQNSEKESVQKNSSGGEPNSSGP